MALQFLVDTGGTLTTNLIAYWMMEEASGTRFDAIGSNDLSDNNTVTSTTGIQNTAGQFTRTNSEYLNIADNTDLSMGNIDFSIALWVFMDSKPITAEPISKWNQAGSDREYRLRYVGGGTDRFEFSVSDNGSNSADVQASTFGSPSTSTWIFIVCWHDATANTINIQVNNGTADSAAHSTGVNNGASDFALGAAISGGFIDLWDGAIDEVGIWKKVLSTQEKTDLYNGGSGNTLTNVVSQTITSDTSIQGTTTQTIDSDSSILTAQPSQTITSDSDIVGTTVVKTITSDSFVQVTATKTITSDTSIKVVGTTQVIGADTTIYAQHTQTIQGQTDILVNEVDLKLFKESDLSTEVGTAGNPIDFGTVNAGTTTLNPDNAFVLFNDKAGLLNSVDAREVTISVLGLEIVDQLLGTSNGSASQSFVVAFPPMVDSSDRITVKVNDVPWTRVSTFAGQDPTSEVYTLNTTTGTIIFGDGSQGKIPTLGYTIKATYTPDTILYGKQAVEQLWVGVESVGVISNTRSVPIEEVTPTDVSHVQVSRHPKVIAINGVFLGTDPFKLGTNYFTGGSFNDQSGIIVLGTPLPDTNNVYVDYTYAIQDDAEGSFIQLGGTTTHEFASPIPANNGKKINFRLVIPSSASPSGPMTIRIRLRFDYVE